MDSLQPSKPYLLMHIGLNLPDGTGPVSKNAVVEFLASLFDSFTVVDALGIFRGEREPALVVGIATDPQRVIDAAADLRAKFGWDGIGIVVNGAYTRVTQDQLNRENMGICGNLYAGRANP